MGFRSTLTSEHPRFKWPTWFEEKYAQLLDHGGKGVLHAPWEMKTWFFHELPDDIQRVLSELEDDPGYTRRFVYVWLHECGGITRVQVSPGSILISFPVDWEAGTRRTRTAPTTTATDAPTRRTSDVMLDEPRLLR